MMLVRLDPKLLDDQRGVDPARPQGPDPRGRGGRDRQAERGLLLRRRRPADQDPPAAGVPGPQGQPRRRRRVRRLREDDQRDRLRVHRRRPPLLQQHGGHRLLEHRSRSPATRSCAAPTRSRSCASATPTRTSSATPASRTSSAGRRRSSARTRSSPSAATLLKIFGKNATTDHNLHTTDGLINLFDLVAFSAVHSIKQIPFPAETLPCYSGPTQGTAGAAAETPACYVTADAGAEQRAFRAFMTPSTAPPASPRPAGRRRECRRKAGRRRRGTSPGCAATSATGGARLTRSASSGSPSTSHELIMADSQYCQSLTSLCPVEGGAGSDRLPPRLPAPRPPRTWPTTPTG